MLLSWYYSELAFPSPFDKPHKAVDSAERNGHSNDSTDSPEDHHHLVGLSVAPSLIFDVSLDFLWGDDLRHSVNQNLPQAWLQQQLYKLPRPFYRIKGPRLSVLLPRM